MLLSPPADWAGYDGTCTVQWSADHYGTSGQVIVPCSQTGWVDLGYTGGGNVTASVVASGAGGTATSAAYSWFVRTEMGGGGTCGTYRDVSRGPVPQLPPCNPNPCPPYPCTALPSAPAGDDPGGRFVLAFGLIGAALAMRGVRTGRIRFHRLGDRAVTQAPVQALTETEVGSFRLLHGRVVDALEHAVKGKRGVLELITVAHVLVRARAAGGRAGHRQDHRGAGAGAGARRRPRAGSSSRRTCCPRDVTGTTRVRAGVRDDRVPARPGLRHVVLADEINRAAAKTQSALLEVMEERTVTVDGVPHPVPAPFLVVATQNPIDLDGTYRLPEAQLDRFLLRTSIGYPDAEHELEVLRPGSAAGATDLVPSVTSPEEVAATSQALTRLHVADEILRYVRAVGDATRSDARVRGWAPARAACARWCAAARCTRPPEGRALRHPERRPAAGRRRCSSHRLVLTARRRARRHDGRRGARRRAGPRCPCRGPARPDEGRLGAHDRASDRPGVGTFLLADAALALGLVAGYPGLVGLGVALLARRARSSAGCSSRRRRGQPPAGARPGAPALAVRRRARPHQPRPVPA